MFGGVRTASQTLAAPPVARSCAISMPDEPAPTTSTLLPSIRRGVAVCRRMQHFAGEAVVPGQSGCAGCARSRSRRRPGARRCRRSTWSAASRRTAGRCARPRCPAAARCRPRGRAAPGARRPGRASGTSACPSGTAGPEGARTVGPCSASAGRSGSATRPPTRSARSISSGRQPRSRRLSAAEIPAGPAPTIARVLAHIRPTVERRTFTAPADARLPTPRAARSP